MFSIRLSKTFAQRPTAICRPKRMTIKADAGVVPYFYIGPSYDHLKPCAVLLTPRAHLRMLETLFSKIDAASPAYLNDPIRHPCRSY